jgi:hypothetical protein
MKTCQQTKEKESAKTPDPDAPPTLDIAVKLTQTKTVNPTPSDSPILSPPNVPTPEFDHLALKAVVDPKVLSSVTMDNSPVSPLDQSKKLSDLLDGGIASGSRIRKCSSSTFGKSGSG